MFRNLVGLFADLRVYLFLVPALVVLMLDLPVLFTMIYALAAVGVVVALAHIGRRILFPYIDMEEFASVALRSPSGAGLVFFGVAFAFAIVVLSTVLWISR